MSAAICGKRSFLDDSFPGTPLIKRVRFCSGSPIVWPEHSQNEFADSSSQPPLSDSSQAFAVLSERFPDMTPQQIQQVVDVYGNDLESAIQYLSNLQLASSQSTSPQAAADAKPESSNAHAQLPSITGNDIIAAENVVAGENEQTVDQGESSVKYEFPKDGGEWVDLFLREMMTAGDIDFARIKVAKVMELFDKFVTENKIQNYVKLEKENSSLKETIQSLLNENQILKRAVAIQHERQKNHDNEIGQVNKLKQTLATFQEKIRTLEMNNYALNVHLKAAQGSSMPNQFNPDIF